MEDSSSGCTLRVKPELGISDADSESIFRIHKKANVLFRKKVSTNDVSSRLQILIQIHSACYVARALPAWTVFRFNTRYY
jgi:hypothetical protein